MSRRQYKETGLAEQSAMHLPVQMLANWTASSVSVGASDRAQSPLFLFKDQTSSMQADGWFAIVAAPPCGR